MNVAIRSLDETFSRRLFTAADVARMVETGIMDEDERVELIEGELIVMPAEKFAHARATMAIARKLIRELPDDWFVGVEKTLRLGSDTLVEPDFFVCPSDQVRSSEEGFLTVSGPDLLVVETADSSLAYDRTLKAALYASHDVREYWIVNLNERCILVHRRPERGGYQDIHVVEADKAAVPEPPGPTSFQLRFGDLG